MRNAAKLGFLPGKLGRGDGVTNFKSCVPAGQADKGRKPDRAVPVVEFMEQKTVLREMKCAIHRIPQTSSI